MNTSIESTSATAKAASDAASPESRQKLAQLAAEFESMLLNQMLRDMSEAGKWSSIGSSGGETLGAETFEHTFQMELSRYLAMSGGLGLSQQLLKALDAMSGIDSPAAGTASTPSRGLPAAVTGEAGNLRVPGSVVTSAYGWRHDPFTGAAKFHKGVDLRAPEGSDVVSAGAGRVTFSGTSGGYGTSVIVQHADGVSTRYAHLSEALVKVGDEVSDQQLIGRAGHTGRATAAHLHFEVLEDGVAVDPLLR